MPSPSKNKHFFSAVQNKVWALLPAKLEEISLFVDRRLAGEKLEFPEAAGGKGGNRADDTYEVRDGVAILPVYGILDKRMNLLMEISGGTSTELLARDFRQALADPKVLAILLDVDSPGGAVDGTKEVADLVFAARASGKPVVAYANGLMASAAYWIGSAAQAVIAPATAEIGSIGVALMHYDYSEADAMEGIKRTAITGGKYKRIASDEKPLSDEGREYLQAMVDDYYGLFLEAVARQRDADLETVAQKMADGRIFVGKKALKAGLVDKIGSFDDALALARAKGGAMPKNITKEQLQTENPELFALIKAEGAGEVTLEVLLAQQPEAAARLRAAGETAERARVVEILEAAGLKGLCLQVIQEGVEPKEAFKKMLQAHDQVKAAALAAMAAAASPPVGAEDPKIETHTVAVDPNLPLEARAKASWDSDPKIREEFKAYDTYLAFCKADEAGRVKIKIK
jgi:signal peptide peptidase SppA